MDKSNSILDDESRKILEKYLKKNNCEHLLSTFDSQLKGEEEVPQNGANVHSNNNVGQIGEVSKTSPKSHSIDIPSVLSETEIKYLRKYAEENQMQGFISECLQSLSSPQQSIELDEKPLLDPVAEEERINAIIAEIDVNLAKRIAEEEERILKELEAEKSNSPKKKTSKIKKVINSFRGTPEEDEEEWVRLTVPKKRGIIGRLINRQKYDKGWMDYIKEAYLNGEITQEDVDESRDADSWFDRSLYRRVQNYEDAVEDVAIKRGWQAFKAGLLAVLLSAAITLGYQIHQMVQNWREAANRVVTIHNATEEERTNAMSRFLIIVGNTEYEFENLSDEELLDATLRIPVVERTINDGQYKGAFLKMKDQELLTKILEQTYGDELKNFSPEEIRDLKQLAYEFIEGENQDYIRDPQVIDKLVENQNEEDREMGG